MLSETESRAIHVLVVPASGHVRFTHVPNCGFAGVHEITAGLTVRCRPTVPHRVEHMLQVILPMWAAELTE
eukprot:170371-Heterocapsa_arctica.AAC.1